LNTLPPRDPFHVQDNTLYCEGCSIATIARAVGTPAYVYSRQALIGRFRSLANAFASIDHLICYSVKANSNLSIIRTLAQQGAGVDIVSGGELYRALTAGVDPQKIVFSGVGKTAEEIDYALRSNILSINVESIPELIRINEVSKHLGVRARVSLRLNPDVSAKTHHEYTQTGKKEDKFGLPISQAMHYYRELRTYSNLDIFGINAHIGSQIIDVTPYLATLDKLRPLIVDLRADGMSLKALDLGGGMGIRYHDEQPFSADDFATNIISKVRDLQLRLLLEPGRFIVGNAGVLISKVLFIKTTTTKTFVIVDAAMNDLIRPALYNAYHRIDAVTSTDRRMTADVVGPVCESGDFFAKKREIPEVRQEDLIAIYSAGAYGFAMASNYNSRPRPVEVLVDGDRYSMIRKRETYDDLIRGESESLVRDTH